MLPYVITNEDTIILHLDKGPISLSKGSSFNFNKIKRLLLKKAPMEEIVPLLETPEYPNGVYKAYLNKDNILWYEHIDNEGVITPYSSKERIQTILHKDVHLGIYASVDDIRNEYPEYFI